MKHILLYLAVSALCILHWNPTRAQNSLDLTGSNGYVSYGNNSKLGLAQFTLECWFKRKGTGATTSTGTGGVTAVPLITKGRGEADGSTLDMNYFFGIQSSTNVLCADFEEGSGGASPGLNHPVTGTTAIVNNVWYHAAVTYDGTTWKLYLNGNLEATLAVNQPVQSSSVQHSALGSALTSTGVAQGYFNGTLDEVRVWNSAKSQSDILLDINKKITAPKTGLVGRWGLDEGSGTTIGDISGNAITGTITGTGYAWLVGEAPYNVNQAPVISSIYPFNAYDCLKDSVQISYKVSDAEKDTITAKVYVRIKKPAPPNFTFIPIPDTQFYTQHANGGNNSYFKAQTNWIVNNKDNMNIVHVCQLGDCVQNGDNGGNDIEWKRADTSMKIIEDPVTTKLKDGIPFTMNVGNHDQSPGGDAKGSTTFYNQYFGVSRYTGREYWGGNYGSNNDNNYQLFSASGIDFIAISLEYDVNADTNVLNWASNLLKTYNKRKGIIISHWIINSDGSFGAQGLAIYNRLKANPNLFMMLCGHINPNGEARRSDVFNGRTVHTILSDYQDRANGGSGWLRIMKFSPGDNSVKVQTYSPTLNQFETDANSDFTINNLDLIPEAPYTLLDSVRITTGSATISKTWTSLLRDTTYEWYIEIKDRYNTVKTSKMQFYTRKPIVDLGADIASCENQVWLDAKLSGVDYLWASGEKTQTIVANKAQTYSVIATLKNSTCNGKDSIDVVLLPKPITFLGPDTVVCNDGLQISANLPNMQYLWSTAETTEQIKIQNTGIYRLKITDPANGCSSEDTIHVLAGTPPLVNLGPDFSQCGGTRSLQLENKNCTFLWSDGSALSQIKIQTTGWYAVNVTDQNGCYAVDTVFAEIKLVPTAPQITGKTENCTDALPPKLSASGKNVVWYKDSTMRVEIGKGNHLQLSSVGSDSYFAIQSQNGCASPVSSVVLKEIPLPVVSITGLANQYESNAAPVNLVGNPTGGTFSGNGVVNGRLYPANLEPGYNYTVFYTYVSAEGCLGTTSKSVFIKANTSGVASSLKSENGINIYPNPFHGSVQLTWMAMYDTKASLTLQDNTGRKVSDYDFQIHRGENNLEIQTPQGLAPGTYILVVRYGDIAASYVLVHN